MRVGIIGFGHLGLYIWEFIKSRGVEKDLQLAFVWNRTKQKIIDAGISEELILNDIKDVASFTPDIIVEVAHPSITRDYGEFFLSIADYFVGSPSIFSEKNVEDGLRAAAEKHQHGLYIPAGAMWGSKDIQKMASLGTLTGLKITMKKHPSSFRLEPELKKKNDAFLAANSSGNPEEAPSSTVLYNGPVRRLCSLAPVNVNTMAVASMAASNLGFDEVVGCLVSDFSLKLWHVIEVEVSGLTDKNGNTFTVRSTRNNPCTPGAVTGKTTLEVFCSSLCLARGLGAGVHIC